MLIISTCIQQHIDLPWILGSYNSSSGAQIDHLQCLITTLVKAFGPPKDTLVNRHTYPFA